MTPFPTKTEMVVLERLMAGAALYGLEIVAQSGGKLKRGTIYVLLDRLEHKGLISSKVEASDGRRRYRITGQGKQVMRAGGKSASAQMLVGSTA